MAEILLLDTNVLPVFRGLDGPLWLSVRKLCEVEGIELSLPAIVVEESLNLRAEYYGRASTRLIDALAETSRFFDMAPVYLPDVSEVRSSWDEEIRRVFSVMPLDGDDAVEALHREASRTPPARNGVGARDSAIWLTVKRAASSGRRVRFVSNNYRDFGVKKSEDLHPTLADEASAIHADIQYFRSLEALIASVATRVGIPDVARDDLEEILGSDLRQRALEAAATSEICGELAKTALDGAGVRIDEYSAKQAFLISDRNLTLVIGEGALLVGHDAGPAVVFSFRAWLDFSPDDGQMIDGEVQELSVIGLA